MRTFRQFADISNNNSAFYAKPYAKAGHLLVAIKATEGAHFIDPMHAAWTRDAHRVGLVVMHYHYCRPDLETTGYREAETFWRIVKPTYRPGDLLCLDLEVHAPQGPKADAAYFGRQLMGLLAISGHHPIGYTYDGYLENSSPGLNVPGKRWWVAAYGGPKPNPGRGRRLWAWQYTDGKEGAGPHEFAGIGRCDGSVLNLASSLRLLAGSRQRRRACKRAARYQG